MAEYLIYNKTHWMDEPSKGNDARTGYERNQDKINDDVFTSPLVKLDKLSKLSKKYEAKEQSGDIIEERPDGFGMRSKKEILSFCLVKVPEKKESLTLDALKDGASIKYNRKYNLDISKLEFDEKKEITITEEQFNDLLTEKTVEVRRIG